MGADYMERIVARATGAGAVSTTPLIAPRVAADPTDDDRPEMTGGTPPPRTDSFDEPGSSVPHHRQRDPRADSAIAPDQAAHSASLQNPGPPRLVPAATREIGTHTVLTQTHVVDCVVTHRDVAVSEPRPVADDRAAIAHVANPPPTFEAAARADDEVVERRLRTRNADAPASVRPIDVARATPPSAPPRSEPVPRLHQRGNRRETPNSIRPRPAREAPARPRAAPRSSRLVIGSLVVEVVQPPAPPAARQVTRPAPSAPRPFRADAPSNLALGRASGLGQV